MNYAPIIQKNLVPSIYKISNRIVTRGSGSWLYDIDNTKILDFTSGIGVVSLGHCHPEITSAIKPQLDKLVHGQMNCMYNEPMLQFTEKLNTIFPANLQTYFYTNSGSEAIENAIKISRASSNKPNIIAFKGGFHGRTLGAASLSASKSIQKYRIHPLMGGVIHTDYPDCMQCNRLTADGCCNKAEDSILDIFSTLSHPDDIAAIIIECVQGEGGYRVATPNFMKLIGEICNKHNIHLIVDEVQSGIARTGKMFAYQHFDMKPDIVCWAKGIANGFPLGGVSAKRHIFDNIHTNMLGGTYGGGPIVTTAGRKTLEIIEEQDIITQVNNKHEYLKDNLLQLKGTYSAIIDVRGFGLMMGIEFNKHFRGIAFNISAIAEKNNLFILTAGNNEVIRLLPPLNVSYEEIDIFLDIFEKCLIEALLDKYMSLPIP